MRRELVVILALVGAPSALAKTGGEAPLVALVDGTVTLAGGTPIAMGDRLSLPAEINATGGTLSLVWEENGARLLLAGMRSTIRYADAKGVRLSIGNVRLDIPAGQGLQAKHRPEKTARAFLGAPADNTGTIGFAACQTVVRLLPGSTASVLVDLGGMEVAVQGEGGVVEVLDREGSRKQLHAGEQLLDGCVPPPGEASIEPPETRSALTPFQP